MICQDDSCSISFLNQGTLLFIDRKNKGNNDSFFFSERKREKINFYMILFILFQEQQQHPKIK